VKLARATFLSFLVAVFTFLPTGLIPADAELQATATSNVAATSLSTGTFVVYATRTPTGANPNGTALVLSRTSAAQYFYVRNTGSIAVTRFTIMLTYDGGPGNTTIDRCNVGVAFTSLNTCASGSRTAMTITNSVITLTIQPNTWFAFELDPRKTVTPTVNISVASSQIRSPIVTNS